jgi:thiol-disulfide isomerase/thioredoxin
VSKLLRPSMLATLVIGSIAALAAYAAETGVTLTPIKFDAYLAKIAANKSAKLTVVDAWATWCAPCKENFPHLVEMHKKYGNKGLAVISLSLDDVEKPKKLAEAKAFLTEKGATFPNFVLDETQDAAFERLNITAIPAVFLFGPDGKEIKRFTLDDPNKQFTYDEVDKAIAEALGSAK